MALSFLYLAFVRILPLMRLTLRDSDELAIEVVMLRHEVTVLRRQVVRPALRPRIVPSSPLRASGPSCAATESIRHRWL